MPVTFSCTRRGGGTSLAKDLSYMYFYRSHLLPLEITAHGCRLDVTLYSSVGLRYTCLMPSVQTPLFLVRSPPDKQLSTATCNGTESHLGGLFQIGGVKLARQGQLVHGLELGLVEAAGNALVVQANLHQAAIHQLLLHSAPATG